MCQTFRSTRRVIFTYMRSIRLWIRSLIREMVEKEKKNEKLLTEPDQVDERAEDETDEMSTVASIAGVTTPLGTGPTYPGAPKKRKKKNRRKVGKKSK